MFYERSVHAATGLIEFDSNEPLAYWPNSSTFDMPATNPTFLRQVRMWGNAYYHRNLRQSLELADETFEAVAGYCGAIVPYHRWGLQRIPENDAALRHRYYEDEIPENYRLVAEVEVIDNLTHLNQYAQKTLDQVLGRFSVIGTTRTVWRDANALQFASGGRARLKRTRVVYDRH